MAEDRRYDPHLGKGVRIQRIMDHLAAEHSGEAPYGNAFMDQMPTVEGAHDLAKSVHWWCHTGDGSLDKPGWRLTD